MNFDPAFSLPLFHHMEIIIDEDKLYLLGCHQIAVNNNKRSWKCLTRVNYRRLIKWIVEH